MNKMQKYNSFKHIIVITILTLCNLVNADYDDCRCCSAGKEVGGTPLPINYKGQKDQCDGVSCTATCLINGKGAYGVCRKYHKC